MQLRLLDMAPKKGEKSWDGQQTSTFLNQNTEPNNNTDVEIESDRCGEGSLRDFSMLLMHR